MHGIPVGLIDNYDSFTYNIVQALQGLGHQPVVWRNDDVSVSRILAVAPRALILSPGPMSPTESGRTPDIIAALEDRLPILGICLGFQCLLHRYGVTVAPLDEIIHGRATPIRHNHEPLWAGFPDPFPAARYHSLGTRDLPAEFIRLAWTDSGILMAARHRHRPLVGVQFHPESFLTPNGGRLFTNFFREFAHEC